MTVIEFARTLRQVRGHRTQREFAFELGVDTMRVSRWERAACAPSVKSWRILNSKWPNQFPIDARPSSSDDTDEHSASDTERQSITGTDGR
jgi:hypothetical protein